MKYFKKLNIFSKERKSQSFDSILINLQKFIDSSCDDEISYKSVFQKEKFIKVNQVIVKNIIDPKSNRDTRFAMKDWPGTNKIEIRLSEDENNFISILLSYDMSTIKTKRTPNIFFDMLTWDDIVVKNNMQVADSWDSPQKDSLYNKIRDYLIDNQLIGVVI